MNYLEVIILHCIKSLQGERSIYAIYHILKGKKSSQTIQDIHLFRLTNLFQLGESLTRDDLELIILKFNEEGWVTKISDQHFVTTPRGDEILQREFIKNPLPIHLNGWKYHQKTKVFWERLSLLVQVVSNLVYQQRRYSPIQRKLDVHLWLKNFLKGNQQQRQFLGEILFRELVHCLEEGKDIMPEALVNRLTGSNQIGMTAEQNAARLKMDLYHFQLQYYNVIHFLIGEIEGNSPKYSILTTLIDTHPDTLTLSTQKTFEMLKSGFSIESISEYRNLKKSTIEDHIVEIALNIEDFSIDPFVDAKQQESIRNVSKSVSTRQLRSIREVLKETSYFEIRLVLAKSGDRQWN